MKKSNLKTMLISGVSAVLAATLAIGGTVAYLTWGQETKSNVFTVGDIDITLDEKVGVFGEGATVTENEDGATYTNVMPGDYLQKEVTVSNTGNNPAYVAVTVTLNNADKINAAIDEVYGDGAEGGQAMYDFIFDGWGINQDPRPGKYGVNDARGVIDGTYGLPDHTLKVDFAKTTKGSTVIGATNWFVAGSEKAGQYWVDGPKAYDGYYTANMDDYEICYTYYIYLESGESSTLFEGLNVPAEFTNAQMKMFDGLKIDVEAAAIQADNMAIATEYKGDPDGKAKTAFSVLAGKIETPEYSNKPTGDLTPAYASMAGQKTWDSIWGEAYTNAKNSLEIKLYSGDTYLGTNSLNDLSKSAAVTWHCSLSGKNYSAWTMTWAQKPTPDLLPTTVELWVDGEKVDETTVRMNCPDDLAPITGAVLNTKGEIVKFTTKNWDNTLAEGESYVAFVSSNTELDNALKNDATTVVLGSGNYIIPDSAKGKTLTIIGNGNTVIATQDDGSYEGCDYSLDGSTVTFKNITINTDSSTYTGYARLKATYENCTINGTYTLYGDSVFNNCTFNVSGDVYNIWTWGASNATFTGCTFNSDGKAMLLYGTVNTKLTLNNCVFNDNGGLTDKKAAVEIGNDYGKSYELIVNNTTVNGYEINDKGINTNTTLWGNKNSMSKDNLNVFVDGVDVY
ncbi:MAG: hypothetical protein IJX47_08500 [Clostridia bacterium]|nr:hypothetical protein [Clostridia bacterium]